MSSPAERLGDLGRRIERIVTAPETIHAPLVRLVRPVLRRVGYQPKVSVKAIRILCDALRERSRSVSAEPADLKRLVRFAVDELEASVASVERTAVVNRSVPVAHAAWLRRLYEVVARAAVAARGPGRRAALRIAASENASALLPPLAIQGTDAEPEEEDAPGESRLLGAQLGAVDHLLDAAREEREVLERRRRLLEAARQLLLETSAALPLDHEGVAGRLRAIGREITWIDRLQAAGVRPDAGLLHQARSAMSRGERQRLFAILSAMDSFAVASGDLETVERTERAIHNLDPQNRARDSEAIAASVERSGSEVFGREIQEAVARGYEEGRTNVSAIGNKFVEGLLAKYLAPGAERATLSASLAVDGCFEVGGVLSPVRVKEEQIRLEEVPFPTEKLVLVPARGPEDVPGAVIDDPRSILLSLAEGKLLTRRFIQKRVRTRSRTVLRGEVRIYVLDGSGSMIGPRARMRDAILIAELATVARRLSEAARTGRVVLFYRYFSDDVGPTTRVDSPDGALAAITSVLATHQSGGTELQAALLASLEQVREARAADPDLARAQIVLVTDGNAPVSDRVVAAAREKAGDLPVGISVIALGEENPALREIVARQRARGERAFYHFVDDAALAAIASGDVDDAPAIHLPHVSFDDTATPQQEAAALETAVGGLLDELGALGRTRDLAAMERLDRNQLLVRTDRPLLVAKGEGERARVESAQRDRRALDFRFRRWFPPPSDSPVLPPEEGTLERGDLESVIVLLATITEVVGLVEGSELARQADAIDLLERLLPDARLSPARYEAVVTQYPGQTKAALEALHGAVRHGILRKIRGGDSSS